MRPIRSAIRSWIALLATTFAASASCAHAAREARAAGGQMVLFEAGRLRVGGKGDEVQVARFLIDVSEVTARAYAACVGASGCPTPGTGGLCTFGAPEFEEHPINCVTWDQARAYCAWAQKRLPSEAEWEWAARGATAARKYPWGEEPPTDQLCWDGEGNPLGKGGRVRAGIATCPVGSHPRGDTPEGLHDMAGNVLEWTATTYRGEGRAVRGGRWFEESPNQLTTYYQRYSSRLFRDDALGFRCASTP